MKNRKMRYHTQAVRIYRHQYRPSYNVIRLFKTVLAVFLHGSSAPAGAVSNRHK